MNFFADVTRAATAARKASAELDGAVQATAPSVGHCLAHKAQWHNEGTILFYVSAVRNAVTE